MELVAQSAAEQTWQCPTCGRCVVFQGNDQMIVLSRGDLSARHSGGALIPAVEVT